MEKSLIHMFSQFVKIKLYMIKLIYTIQSYYLDLDV